MRILSVGKPSPHTSAVLARLLQRGFAHHDAATLAESAQMLETFRFDVVLAPENLPDGKGYQLAAQVAQQSGSLVVSVQLSETSLWLPVVVRGAMVLGERALNTATLEWDLAEILATHAGEHVQAVSRFKAIQAAGRRAALCAGPRRSDAVTRAAVADLAEKILVPHASKVR